MMVLLLTNTRTVINMTNKPTPIPTPIEIVFELLSAPIELRVDLFVSSSECLFRPKSTVSVSEKYYKLIKMI